MTMLKERSTKQSVPAVKGVAFLAGVAVGATALLASVALIFGGTRELSSSAIFTTDQEGTLSLIDTETGTWIYEMPDAVLAPDRSVVIQATEAEGQTYVRALDPVTAEERWNESLPSRLSVRVVSPGGDLVALMRPSETPGLYVPEPRTATTIYVARTDGSPWRRYTLQGNFVPEAFTTSGETLFLLKFLPAEDPYYYEVHRLNLQSGDLLDAFIPEVELEPSMRGHARTQVMTPDGKNLLTLYSLEPDEERIANPLDASKTHYAFVHVISLEDESSFCIFLPSPFGQGDIDKMGIAHSPDGKTLVVLDLGPGIMADIDLATNEIVRTNHIGFWPLQPGDEQIQLAIGADQTLYFGWDGWVSAYEPVERNSVAGWSAEGEILAMDVSVDGRYLRTVIPGAVRVIDLVANVEVSTIALPASAGAVVLGPPRTRTSSFEAFTCAC